jgi:hypothetical protein
MAEQHEVDASERGQRRRLPAHARRVLVDDGIRPLDFQVIAQELAIVGVVVDD